MSSANATCCARERVRRASQKHSLLTPQCPDRNLPDKIIDRPDVAGKTVRELFDIFCVMAHIKFEGEFLNPDGEEGMA